MAQMLSFAMLLRYSFDMEEDAALIERACTNVLASGLRTAGRDGARLRAGRHAGDGRGGAAANWTSSRPDPACPWDALPAKPPPAGMRP